MTSMCVQEPRQRRSELSSVPFPPFERLSRGRAARGPSAEPAWEVFAQLAPPPRASYLCLESCAPSPGRGSAPRRGGM